MADYVYAERSFFPWCNHKSEKREIFLVKPVSGLLKLVYNLTFRASTNLLHLSCKQFHNTVKDNSAFLRNLRKL